MRTWFHRLTATLAGASIAAAALAGCGAEGGEAGDSDEFKLGVILPLSGVSATVGESARDGITEAVKYINDNGGIEGAGGAKIELVIADHRGDKDAGRAAAIKLIDQDGVDMVLGSANSNVSLVLSQVCALRSIPCVSTDAAQGIVANGEGWTFRPLPTMDDYVTSLVEAYTEFGAANDTRVAAVVSQGDLGDEVLNAAEEKATEQGWSFVGGVSYPPTTTNFLPIAQKLKGENPDAVVALSYGEAAQLKKSFDEIDFRPVILGVSSGWAGTPLVETLKEQSNGILAAAGFASDLVDASPELQAMSDAHVEDTGSIPDTNYWIFNGAGFMIAEALGNAGTADADKLKAALGSVKMDFADPSLPIVGGIDMAEGENKAVAPPVLQIQDAKQVTVWPSDLARADADTTYGR